MVDDRLHKSATADAEPRAGHRQRLNVFVAAVAAALLSPSPAAAHAPYDEFLTPFGLPCCGGEDCYPLADGDVSAVPDGYFISSRREFVPKADAQPGPDNRYHICTFQGLRMCFLIPPGPGA